MMAQRTSGAQNRVQQQISLNQFAARRSVPGRYNAPLHVVRASNNSPVPADESFNMLDSFFVGRALAEVLNERLGSAAADVLAEFGKLEAEVRREIRDFQDEVLARARRDMADSSGASGSISSSSSRGDTAGSAGSLRPASPPDLGEAVDNLRAEIASARAVMQQLKAQKNTT